MDRERPAECPKKRAKILRPLAFDQHQSSALARSYKTAPIGLAFFDTDLRFVHVNDWLAAINGLTVEEHLGRRLSTILPDVAQGVDGQLRGVIETGEPILCGQVHAETPSHPGSKHHYEHNYYPEKSDDGTVIGIRCVVQDVTERTLAQERVRELTEELENRFQTIIEHSPDATIVTDREGRIEQLNERASSLFGYTNSALRGKPVSSLLPPELAEAHRRHVARFSGHPTNRDMGDGRELLAKRKDGTLFPVEISLCPIEEKSGVSIVASIRDVSRQKNREEQLRRALEEVSDLRSRLEAENTYLQEEIQEEFDFEGIVGSSARFREALRRVDQVAETDSSVLVLGETGTGKELVVRAIHNRSRRSRRPLVKVNCAAIPAGLMESEFFGHERGAFTGALTRKKGRFELADGGTIFLDEIGDLSLDLQAKLLRVLQEGEFERLGSTQTTSVDVRVLAASNRDLKSENGSGFRSDLYYRLNVFPIEVPPLRERVVDIPLLVWYFIAAKQSAFNKTIETVPVRVMEAMQSYSWPGNVRELENVIERALIISPGRTLIVDEIFGHSQSEAPSEAPETLDEIQRAHIVRVLDECDWTVKGPGNAAECLGLNESTLRSRMKKLCVERPPR